MPACLSASPMKIRSSMASRGRFISDAFHLIDRGRANGAEPHEQKTQGDGGQHVAASVKPFAIVHQIERLEAEGRKGRIPAAEAGHDVLARAAANEEPAIGCSQRRKKADHERSRNVYDDRAPRKGLPDGVGDDPRQPVARQRAERAAESKQEQEWESDVHFDSLEIRVHAESMKSAQVEVDDSGARLDRWFRRHYPAVSHGQLEKLLRTGQIRLDGKRAKSGDRISTGQIIRLPPQIETAHKPVDAISTKSQPPSSQQGERARKSAEAIVIKKDSSVLVINKPSGLATQGGSGIKEHVDGLLEQLTFGKRQKPRLVHRLDRDTSGVLLVARTVPAAAALSDSLRRRDAEKIYWALTKGVPDRARGRIRSTLGKEKVGRDEKMREVEADSENAKAAVTDYLVVDTAGREYAWLAVKPRTGRTHQIRVHLASLGTPIVGDFKYGGAAVRGRGEIENRLHLHARSIDIAHPEGGRLNVTAPLPPHMQQTWNLMGFDAESPTARFARERHSQTR